MPLLIAVRRPSTRLAIASLLRMTSVFWKIDYPKLTNIDVILSSRSQAGVSKDA
jgi:hypothetical protein